MTKANYIIFHPDYAREKIEVSAACLVATELKKQWVGCIWVDEMHNGNEDPYVFHNDWIYSYCHASQLRRSISNCYIQTGSWLIFCSGDEGNDGILCVDTAFKVGTIHEWTRIPNLELPPSFRNIRKTNKGLWKRHFCFPFNGHHKSVTHSYEAELGIQSSFLPLLKGERTTIELDDLPSDIRSQIANRIYGKYPVLLEDKEIEVIIKELRKRSDTLVLQDIKVSKMNVILGKSKSRC